ncbi:MAG: AAA family ATPase [Bacteroidota bacterium]
MNKIIITGGPGSGKTTLINSLEQLSYNCSKEASRQLIIEQVAKKSDCLPWINLGAFADLVLERIILLYENASKEQITFFDRGIPDIIAYLTAAKLPVPSAYYDALTQYPYNNTVLILPPWPEIYLNDDERWQTYEESVAIYQAIRETYQSLNFTLVEVPKTSISGRVAFVTDQLN